MIIDHIILNVNSAFVFCSLIFGEYVFLSTGDEWIYASNDIVSFFRAKYTLILGVIAI